MNARRSSLLSIPTVLMLLVGGCMYTPAATPSYPAADSLVRSEYDRMAAEPVVLERPVYVLDGWRQPEFSAASIERQLIKLTGAEDPPIKAVSYAFFNTFDAMAADIVKRVEREWPSDDPEWTSEVDIVGFSMGGLIARAAELPPTNGKKRKRLRIRNLYTICTPHSGSKFVKYIAFDFTSYDMRPGSKFLARLNDAFPEAQYELVCYAQLNDAIVGAKNTAPPGRDPIWTGGTWMLSHLASRFNRRILVDIALRLRGEKSLAGEPSRPPRN